MFSTRLHPMAIHQALTMIFHEVMFLGSVVLAFLSATWIKLSSATVPENWWEASPYVIFIGALSYAVTRLWATLRELEKQRAEKDKETIERQSAANERLAKAIEQLARDHEGKN